MHSQIIIGADLNRDLAPAVGAEEVRSIENPATPISYDSISAYFGDDGGTTRTITPRRSLNVDTVWACVSVISRTIARMRCHLYKRVENDGRERAVEHPLYPLLHRRPSIETSAFAWKQSLIANMLLWGNAYAEIVRDRSGVPISLHPIEAERVRIERLQESGELVYRVRDREGGSVTLLKRDVIHLVGFSLDGVVGLSVIAHARARLAASMAGEEFNETFTAKAMRPAGVVKTKKSFKTQDAIAEFRKSFQSIYSGSKNAGNVIVLEEDAEYQPLTMPLQDAQWIESQQLGVETVCRWFGVPPHKVGHLARSTNNNIEHQGLEFLEDTLAPILESLEEELIWKLLDQAEQKTHYFEHDARRIIAMDAKNQAEVHAIQLRTGVRSPDEVRADLNLNALPDGRGKMTWIQSSMMPLPSQGQANALIDSWVAGKSGSTGSSPT